MEASSSARGPHRWRKTWTNEAHDLQSYQSELVRIIASELPNTEVVFGQVESGSSALDLPAYLKAHLERHPALYAKLERGELVGISDVERAQIPRPVGAARSSVLILPVMNEGILHGGITFALMDEALG